MNEAGRTCIRCGNILRPGGAHCGRCGAPSPTLPEHRGRARFDLPRYHQPRPVHGRRAADGHSARAGLLFRLAVGPAADYYAPRFLSYESARRAGMHWPSFLLPSVWAFHRKLWLAGFTFALPPVAAHSPLLPSPIASTTRRCRGCSAQSSLSGSCPASFRRSWQIHWCIAGCGKSSHAPRPARAPPRRWQASWREAVRHRSPRVCCSAAQHCCWRPAWWPSCVAPGSSTVRAKVTAARQRPAAATAGRGEWDRVAIPLSSTWMRCVQAATAFDEVSFRPANGRLRLGLGRSIPELFGRSILLAPAVDASQIQ